MSENNMNSAAATEPSNKSLKEALCAQQRLLQKLYNELDVEREAAASAASEALSMILRLQGEKAAVKMEAEQYKRLAEEKMNHAEESMEVFEEYMYHKEMEIASLDYQVQAYRYKLLSLGFDDLGVNEIKYPENLLQRNESLVGETSSEAIAKNKATPPRRLKLPSLKKCPLERDRSITEDSDTIARIVEESSRDDESNQNLDLEKKADGSSYVDINSYLEQIRKLDKVVEEISGEQFVCPTGRTSRCSSVRSRLNEMDLPQSSQKSTYDKISSDARSSSVHDVFEVPQIHETFDWPEKKTKDEEKSIFKDDEKLRKSAAFPQEPVKSFDKDEFCPWKKPPLPKHKDKKLFLPGDGMDVDCHWALVRRTASAESEAMSQRMKATNEITEGGGEAETEQNARQESRTTTREQELRLLYEIRQKLNSIESDIRSGDIKIEPSPNYDLPMLQLSEAMLHFWF